MPFHLQHPRRAECDEKRCETEQRAHLRFVQQPAVRKRRGRKEQRDGEADAGDDADDDQIAPRDACAAGEDLPASAAPVAARMPSGFADQN